MRVHAIVTIALQSEDPAVARLGERSGQAMPNNDSDKFGQRLRRWRVPTGGIARSR